MFARAMCDAGARGHAEHEVQQQPLLQRWLPRVCGVRMSGLSTAEVLRAIGRAVLHVHTFCESQLRRGHAAAPVQNEGT